MEKQKWLMPMYYKNFKCKCEKCRHTCCHGWKIPISQDEYFRLIGMECSNELHDRIEVAFENPKSPDENCYKYISFNWLGECPIQKDGLCMIHNQCGEDNLPKICKLYPRSLKQINSDYLACCSSSCEAVIEMLFDADQLTMVEDYLDENPHIKYELEEDAIQEIFKFNDILKDRSKTLVQSLIDICKVIDKVSFEKDYNNDKDNLINALDLLNRFSNSDSFMDDINNDIRNRYINNLNQYEIDKKEFEKKYPNWMHFFENVINNSLLYECFPFVDKRFDKTKAYKGLCATYGLLRLISIGYTSIHNSKDDLIDCVAELFHLIDHTAFYYNVNILCENTAAFLKL